MTVQIHNIEQRTDEWYAIRRGKLTSSMVAAAIGDNGQAARTRCLRDTVREAHGFHKSLSHIPPIKWGIDNEDVAVDEYAFVSAREFEKVGFVTNSKYPNQGSSPDRFYSEDFVLEVKCPYSLRNEAEPYFSDVKDTRYWHQIQHQMLISERNYCIFLQWTPNGYDTQIIDKDPDWWADNKRKIENFIVELQLAIEEPDDYLKDDEDDERTDLEWWEAAQALSEAKVEEAAAKVKLQKAKKALLDLAGPEGGKGFGASVTPTSKQGSINYQRFIEENYPDVDEEMLEKYREEGSTYMTVRSF